jgi:hypothetical protein
MNTESWWQKIEARGNELLEQLKSILHEGNVRRVIIKQRDRTVAEFPLTVGVVGTVAAPILAAVEAADGRGRQRKTHGSAAVRGRLIRSGATSA